MILAITSQNEKFVTEVCKESELEELQVLTGVKSLNRFAIDASKKLNSIFNKNMYI